MEKQPSYVLRLSLEEMSLRKVVVNLWNETDILASIVNFGIDGRKQTPPRETVVDKVKAKVSELVLPEPIKKQMMHIIKPIGYEIQTWKKFHEKYLSDSREELDVSILEKLCWTSLGAIEYKKTAEKLINCGMLDVVKRYKLACLYCLEDYIPGFWEELPEEVKSTFYDKKGASDIETPSLHLFWPYILKGEEHMLDGVFGYTLHGNTTSFHRCAFLHIIPTGNKAAVEYFLQKLTNEGEEAPLYRLVIGIALTRRFGLFYHVSFFPMGKTSEVLFYLLSLMTPEQQMDVLKKPALFFRCFLDWQFQDLFLEMADLVWPILSELDYRNMLDRMREAFISSGYYYPKLFQEFFIHTPIEFRKDLVGDEPGLHFFLPKFFNNEDSETIRVIFRNIDVDDRLKFISFYTLFNILDRLIVRDEWHLVELCLREATLSKEGRESLKDNFMEFLKTEDDKLPIKPQEWGRFFQLLDEIYGSTRKRSSEFETLAKAKKLCSEE